MFVKINLENSLGGTEDGKVAEKLTDGSFHHFGVKVKLESGSVGRVKIIYGFDLNELILHELILETTRNELDDEGQYLERKASFMFNYDAFEKTGKKFKGMEKNVYKAIQAFANADGGIIYVGIDDEKNVLGLQNDFELIGENANADEFEQTILSQLESVFCRSSNIFEFVSVKIIPFKQKQICIIKVKPSPKAFIRIESGEHKFFVRHGNTSGSLYSK